MATMQKARDVLASAVECDEGGQVFQALAHYTQGTRLLMQMVDREDELERQNVYYERIKQYMDRSEDIKYQIKLQVTQGKQLKRISIPENSTLNGYEKIFGKYLTEDVQEILLEEPLLDEKFHDLTKFLELVVCKCPCVSYIRIATKPSQRDKIYQIETLQGIKEDMDDRLILLNYVIESVPIEPKIILNNGYIIKMDRGLHYFQFPHALFNLGLCEYNLRRCLESTIDIFKTQPFMA